MANFLRLTFPRNQVQELRDPRLPLQARETECAPVSFDEAVNKDMIMQDELKEGQDGAVTPRDDT